MTSSKGALRFARVVAGLLPLLVAGAAFAHFGPVPISLVGAPVPETPGLTDGPDPIVVDEAKAIALGKALFWDVNVGSDGMACASCHFHAGADRRVSNQIAPQGKHPLVHDPVFSTDAGGAARGPNARLEHGDFPFFQTDAPLNPLGNVLTSTDDVVASAGTFGGEFTSVAKHGGPDDTCERAPDSIFHVGVAGTRRVEPRNAPTVINAIFNFRNLWDGAANNVFNGSSQWGDRDPDAGVWVRTGPATVEKQRLRLLNASLASQALAPPLDDVEMSCGGRDFAALARKLACRRPLEDQEVHPDDSVLGPLARSTPAQLEQGLATNYFTLITQAFAPKYWSYEARGEFGAPAGEGALPYSQIEANFAMFFGLAIQLYEATLISDDSRFDRSAVDVDGIPTELTASERNGFQQFRVAHCGLCHIGPVFTPAAVVTNAMMVEANPQAFGSETFTISTTRNVVTRASVTGGPGILDTGFANNGVTLEEWDRGLGASDPFGHPLSFADQYLQRLAGNTAAVVDPYVEDVRPCDLDIPLALNVATPYAGFFTQAQGVIPQTQGTENCFIPVGAFLPTPAAAAAELASPTNARMLSAADGSFKIPTLRNVELTGPYMHNGSMATLEEVLEFYTRGGNFDPDAKHFGTVFPQVDLRFNETNRQDIIAFLRTLTDDRVRYERAPFDHPALHVPHGHVGNETSVELHNALDPELGSDAFLLIPAVGASGRAEPLEDFASFLAPCEICLDQQIFLEMPQDPPPAPEVCVVPEPIATAPIAIATLLWLERRRRRGGALFR